MHTDPTLDVPEIPEWWSPKEPKQRAHGHLSVGSDGATLTLVDHLPGFLAGDYDGTVLLGETESEKLTLLHPVVTHNRRRMSQERTWFGATVKSDTLLRGVHVEDLDTAKFDHATVRLAGLRDMCLHNLTNAKGEDVTYVTPGMGARFVKLPRGQLVFRQWQQKTETPYRETKEVGIEVEIHPTKPLTLGEFDSEWLRPLEAFTILGARGPTDLQRFILTKVGEGEPDQVAAVETAEPALAAKPLDKYKPLLPLAALGDDGTEAEKVIGRWWKIYNDLGPSAGFLHAALSGEMFLEQKLLQAASFTEAYHRELHHPKGRYLRLRLKDLIERAHQTVPDAPGLDSALAKSLADTRNSLAHLNRGLRTGKALEHVDLVYGVAQLRLVLQINLLLDLKLKKTLVRELVWWSYEQGREIPMSDYRK